LRSRIEEAAEGNPLFVEEFLSTLVDGGVLEREGTGYRVTTTPGEIPVPPTIELLLASRLDSLSPEERAVLARSSVIGKQFGAAEVQILCGPNAEPAIVQRLMGLVRKELLRVDEGASEAELDEDIRFRFRHQLLRDAAYEGLPKHERARLHEAYGNWLEGHLGKRLEELREVVGFHLGQAAENRRDVAGNDEQARRLAARSAGHLEAAARRANAIGDSIAVIRLLQRANSLRPVDGVERVTNLPTLAGALLISGQIGEAAATLDEVLASPVATPETRAAALESIWVRFALGKGADDLRPGVEEALRIRREIGEPAGVARALDAMSRLEWFVGRLKRATALAEEGLEYARQTGDIGLEASLRGARRLAFVFMRGVHRTEKLRLLDDELAFARANGLLAMQAQILDAQAIMTGQGGQRADAQALYEQAMTIRRDIGMRLHASASNIQATLDLWAGDFESAAVRLRTICRDLTAMGEKAFLSTAASDLAQALIDLGELNEAEEALRTAEEVGAGDDIATQVGIRAARARLLARRGRLSDAELTGQEAVAVAEAMDYADLLPAAQFALGDVRRLAGRMDEARSEWRAAIAGLDTIGNDLWAERLRKQLAEL
jgi:tetratricopeptide (TPR) repeat protein